MGPGQRQTGVVAERVNGLHEALAEGSLSQDQRAVVILQRARNNLGRRRRIAIHQDHHGILSAVVAVLREVGLFRSGTPAMGDDEGVFRQEMVGHGDTLVEQSAGVLAQSSTNPLMLFSPNRLRLSSISRKVLSPKLRILR